MIAEQPSEAPLTSRSLAFLAVVWLKHHLTEASDKLEELEAEDAKETEARRILELRAKGGGRDTRRAYQAVSDGIDINAPHTDRVGTYVAEQKQWAEGCVEVSRLRASFLKLRSCWLT